MGDTGSSSEKTDLKSLLVKGAIGAVTLAGTTAIPILVQKSLHHPVTPAASSPATAPAPVSATPVISPSDGAPLSTAVPQVVEPDEDQEEPGKKDKKKHKDR